MKTIKDVFSTYKQELIDIYDKNEVEAITLLVITGICGLSKAKTKAFPELEMSPAQSEKLTGILAELKTGKPVQYILGTTEFYGLPFNVNPSVLIPRPETEELVAWVLETVGSNQLAAGSILDIGTGSGCIAISLKKNLPAFKVSAVDISVDALETAKSNAAVNDVDVEFIEADILSEISQISNLASQISIIISNPPYVTLQDKTEMHTNVTDFEPHTALFVPENDPLIFYKVIARIALQKLTRGGLLFFEINEAYGDDIVKMLDDMQFNSIELRKDLNGKCRMVRAALSTQAVYPSENN